MGLGDRLQSMLGTGQGAEPEGEDVRYECPTCGSKFEQPTGADICPDCYETGVNEIADE